MKIPKTLRIGGMTWEVIWSKDVATEGDCFASVHYTSQKIFIEPNLKPENEARSFLHEIIHAITWTTGLDMALKDKPNDKIGEQICSSLDSALLQVIQDNDLDFRR